MNGFRCETVVRQAFGWPEDDPFRRMKGNANPFMKKPLFRNYNLTANENRFLEENPTVYGNEVLPPSVITSECQMTEVSVVSSEQTSINSTSEFKQSLARNGHMDSTHADKNRPTETNNWKTNGSVVVVEQSSNVPKKNGNASSEALLGDRNCALCSEHILPNDGMYTPDGFYHKQCLVCGNCKENLNIWKYINVAGVLYCYPKCNATMTSKSDNKTSKQQICSVCGEQVELHEKLATNEAIYHINCFKCYKCGRTLNVWKYRLDDGKLYCERQCLEVGDTSEMTSVSNTKPTECCLVCGKSVAVPDRVTRFENVFHFNCLKCYRCNRPLNLWKYKIQNEKACCDPCCMRSPTDKKETIIEDGVQCLTCNKPTDTVERVEIQGQFYHPLCFKCTECNRVLNIWRVKLVNGKPHCDPVCQKLAEVKRGYQTERPAECCYHCERKIDQTDCVHAFGQCYHTDCFKCTQCKRQLNIWRSRMENKQPVCDPVCPAKTEFTAVQSPQMTKPTCIFCFKDIQPDDLTQFSHGNSHTDCFKCSACNRQLNIWKYKLTQGKLYCDPQCPKSTHETTPESPKTNKPELNQLHPKSVIQLRDVFQANEKSKDVCYACQKAVYIYDRLFAFNRTYHLKCFTCYKCDRKLNVWKFKTENGRVCCEPLCPVKSKTNSNGHSGSTLSVDSQE